MRRGMRRSLLSLAVSFAALAVVFLMAIPAAAEPPAEPGDGAKVVVTSIGGITTTEWFVNGVLRSQTIQILSGGNLFQSTIRLYPDGNLSSMESRNVSGTTEFITVQSFGRNGALRREMTQERQNGALVSETMTLFDNSGAARVHRTRTLVTRDDGTQVWKLTTQTFADGQPVTRQDVEVPFHHDRHGRSLGNRPIAPPGLVRNAESDGFAESVGASGQSSTDPAVPAMGRSSEHRRDP